MEDTSTELLLKCFFEGIEMASCHGKVVSYIFDCTGKEGELSAVMITIKPAPKDDSE